MFVTPVVLFYIGGITLQRETIKRFFKVKDEVDEEKDEKNGEQLPTKKHGSRM